MNVWIFISENVLQMFPNDLCWKRWGSQCYLLFCITLTSSGSSKKSWKKVYAANRLSNKILFNYIFFLDSVVYTLYYVTFTAVRLHIDFSYKLHLLVNLYSNLYFNFFLFQYVYILLLFKVCLTDPLIYLFLQYDVLIKKNRTNDSAF